MPDDAPFGRDLVLEVKRDERDEVRAELGVNRKGDLATVGGKDNVVQAIRNRLATHRGELAELGHPEYGSLLEDVIGEPNTEDTLRIIETLTHEALRLESRIESILRIVALSNAREHDRVDITVQVRLKETGEILTAQYPFYLESPGKRTVP